MNALVPGEGEGEVEKEVGDEEINVGVEGEKYDAGPPVTQSDDPLSGGHLLLGASKAPLCRMDKVRQKLTVRRGKRENSCQAYMTGEKKGIHTPGPPENVVE